MIAISECVFDETIHGAGTDFYTANRFNELLGKPDKLTIQAVVDNADANGTIEVQIEHSADQSELEVEEHQSGDRRPGQLDLDLRNQEQRWLRRRNECFASVRASPRQDDDDGARPRQGVRVRARRVGSPGTHPWAPDLGHTLGISLHRSER